MAPLPNTAGTTSQSGFIYEGDRYGGAMRTAYGSNSTQRADGTCSANSVGGGAGVVAGAVGGADGGVAGVYTYVCIDI